MKISQKNSYLWERANNLLDRKPSPLSGFELFNYMACMVCNRGKESTTAILQQLNDEIEEHIKMELPHSRWKKNSAYPGTELPVGRI